MKQATDEIIWVFERTSWTKAMFCNVRVEGVTSQGIVDGFRDLEEKSKSEIIKEKGRGITYCYLALKSEDPKSVEDGTS